MDFGLRKFLLKTGWDDSIITLQHRFDAQLTHSGNNFFSKVQTPLDQRRRQRPAVALQVRHVHPRLMRWKDEPLAYFGIRVAKLLESFNPNRLLALDDERKIHTAEREKIQFALPSRPVPPCHRVPVCAVI